MRRAGLQAMAPGAGIDREIEMQTEELDRKYPGLLAVREALEERRAAMAASMLERAR